MTQEADADGSWDDNPDAKALEIVSGQAPPESGTSADEAPQPSAEGAADGTADAAFAGAPIADAPLVLDESRPYGRMQNCPGAHFIQDGNLFGVDKKFIGTQQELN